MYWYCNFLGFLKEGFKNSFPPLAIEDHCMILFSTGDSGVVGVRIVPISLETCVFPRQELSISYSSAESRGVLALLPLW